MAKKFLVWKDKNCNGVNPEWISLTGDKFYEFILKDENRGRRFIKIPPLEQGEDEYIIEANDEQYEKSEKERKRTNYYLNEMMKNETISVYSFADEDNASLYEKTSTGEISIEEAVEDTLLLGKLHKALASLNEDEQKIIKLYYFTEGATERSVADILGVSQPAFHKKMKKIIEKLKKLVIKSQKIR